MAMRFVSRSPAHLFVWPAAVEDLAVRVCALERALVLARRERDAELVAVLKAKLNEATVELEAAKTAVMGRDHAGGIEASA
jgi:hypothetical protein